MKIEFESPVKVSIDNTGQAWPWPSPFDFTVRYVREKEFNKVKNTLKKIADGASNPALEASLVLQELK